MKEHKEFRCVMQPNNYGIRCETPDHCDKCGWNPAVMADRKTMREEKLSKVTITLPENCRDCLFRKLCLDAQCIKEECKHKKTKQIFLDEMYEEMRMRI